MEIKEFENLKQRIIELVESELYVPLRIRDLYSFMISEPEKCPREDFEAAVKSLADSGQIAYTARKKVLSAKAAGYIKGKFSDSGKGFGFVIPDAEYNKDEDIFIPPDYKMGAMNGDYVVVRPIERNQRGYGKGNEGEIISIIERAHKKIIGTYYRSAFLKGDDTIVPDNDKLKSTIIVNKRDSGGAKTGDKVEAEITQYPDGSFKSVAIAKVTDILGDAYSKEANYEAILRDNGVRMEFPKAVLDEAEEVSKREIVPDGRLDLREKIIFTIDGEGAKDLDDAISLDITESGYLLGVHIADVSGYVAEGSALDSEAFARGTSIYFTDKVVPMLPKALSNGSCSLNGGVDRYALSALITLDKSGNIVSAELSNTIINSKIRGVYSEINDIFEKGEQSEFYEKYAHVYKTLLEMKSLYEILAAKSRRNGAMELDSDEAEIILGDDGMPVDIVARERGIGERLIEQFMLCANEAVASWLTDLGLPCVYRIHEEPDPEKIRAFAIFAHNLGIDTGNLKSKKVHPAQLADIMDRAREMGIGEIVSGVLLRSMMKAKYSTQSKGHFGLSLKLYCHFTSPIRRYPDLFVHRLVKAALSGKITADNANIYDKAADAAASMSTENEMKAVNSERQIEDLYMTLYMSEHIGEEMDAVICSVMSFGIFARTDKLCEGLIPINTMDGMFIYDEKSYTLTGGRKKYSLGDKIRVRIENADIITRKVTMSLV